ncbi:MAG: GNAT family N-acetyltransferase [Pseudomonadota bacterium]|nr:GNAT family N-acetyltransferase [Pseudomonadota bacterium]
MAEVFRLGAADLAAYQSLRKTVLAAHPSAFTSDADDAHGPCADGLRARLGLDAPGGCPFVLGARRDGELIGSIGCERDTRRKARHVGHVVGTMVLDAHRGHGVGRALLDACIDRARAVEGLELLTLTVTAGNRAALALYEAKGFVQCGRLPRAIKIGEVYFDKIQMVMALAG